jgi:hypothetical protein
MRPISYQELYTTYYQLKDGCRQRGYCGEDVSTLQLDQDMTQLLTELGLILVSNDNKWFIFLQCHFNSDIPLYYYYHNRDKLSQLIHSDVKIRFIIHWLLYNIHIYLSIDQLWCNFEKLYGTKILTNLNITPYYFSIAHEFLAECELVQYHKCDDQFMYDYQDQIIDLKDKWYFVNITTANHTKLPSMETTNAFLKRYLTLHIETLPST